MQRLCLAIPEPLCGYQEAKGRLRAKSDGVEPVDGFLVEGVVGFQNEIT